ncbi:ammonium transporter [Shimazuella sp. KC615]|uniref:Ammonium transporter n=1 Tax=Shimazuella alba TaxID=2690964 RepID=A0A6I4VSI7_9BACL|nr:ammonium transporter [Shimazuella alba]MXQ53418.1 ammonium transporter [Shimazuella alba]
MDLKLADLSLLADSFFIFLSAVLVIFMQAGFALLEAGSTRMKNAGHIAAKQLLSFSIVAIVFWAVGYGFTFGDGKWIGTTNFFLSTPAEAGSTPIEISFLFQFSFAAVSLAIAWGGFAERAKLSVYILFGALFTIFIYPVIGHWVWGSEGWLHELGKQDFAGSTVVHLTGGVAALIATLMLRPRKGKYNEDGTVNTIPGHNQVYSVLGALIIWLGWFGFNPGSTLTLKDGFFGYVALTTNLGATASVLGAMFMAYLRKQKLEVSIMVNGLLAGLVAITASCAFVEPWAAIIIGFIAGAITVISASFLERRGIDDPIYAFSVHGVAGIWGTISTGIFAAPRLVEKVGVGSAGLLYGGGFHQLGVQTLGVAITILYVALASFVLLSIIKSIVGFRVSEEHEQIGLDISEHGSYAYPEHPNHLEDAKIKETEVSKTPLSEEAIYAKA